MRKVFLIISVLVSLISNGQNLHWMRSYGNNGYDYGKDIKQDLDTGYIVTGSSSSFLSGDADVFLLKIDSLGDFIWSYNYGGAGSDWGETVVLTSDSGYAVGGFTNSIGNGGFDFYLIKTDIAGVPQWQKTYGGNDWDKCYGMVQLDDSGFVMVGETYSYGAGLADGYIVRTNKLGDTLWTKSLGYSNMDIFNDVILDGDSLVIVGQTNSVGAGDYDGWVVKMDLQGNIGWQKTAGRPGLDYFTSITRKNSLYTIGGTRTIDDAQYHNDFWIYQISLYGTQVADTSWGGAQIGIDIVHDIEVDQNTQYIYYGGQTTSWGTPDIFDGVPEFFISRVDPNYYWLPYVQSFGELGEDIIWAMDLCYDGGLVAVGETKLLSTGGKNVFVIKIDEINSYGIGPTVSTSTSLDSITTGIEVFENNLIMYPNPVEDFLYFNDKVEKITVYSMSGEVLFIEEKSSDKIDLNLYKSGMYILEIGYQGSVHRRLVIKS